MNADYELLKNLNGVFVGMLEPHELDAFARLVKANKAIDQYDGLCGFMGLAKVRLLETDT